MGQCRHCGSEVAVDPEYNTRRSEAKIKAYKQLKGIIDLDEISEILVKYDVGKEVLADIAGFGKATIKRYYEGYIPAKEYSDRLLEFLNHESSFINSVEEHKDKLKSVAYHKVTVRCERLREIGNSKTEQITNYIVTQLEEVTPLALEKLLAFSDGVNYALNGTRMIEEDCQAWLHGPVYPSVYNQYKKFGYKPIDNGIHSSHGCMLSKVSEDELKAIDMVLHTFGLYSPKTLETISHKQDPWIEKRAGYGEKEVGREVIDEESVREYYTQNELNTEERIMKYILECLKQ